MNKRMIHFTCMIMILIAFAVPVLSEYPDSDGEVEDAAGTGIITAEPTHNIVKAEMRRGDLIAGTPATYHFTATELAIYQVVVTGSKNENDVAVRVESLESTSKLANTDAPGTLYRNVNVWAGTEKIDDVLIKFKVDNSWIDSNNAAGYEIRLMGHDENGWNLLETEMIGKDNAYTYFESRSTGFSQLAISGLKGEFKPEDSAEASVPKAEGFEITAIMAAALAVYLRFRRNM